MKIKYAIVFFIVTLGFYSKVSFAQQIVIESKFIIQDARINEQDISESWIKGASYLAFYTISGSEESYFASVNPGQKSNSSGRIFNLTHKLEKETASTYENQVFAFKWSYSNSYDDKKGTADVKIVQFKKNGRIGFMCTINPENLDQVIFKGYMNLE